MNLLSSLDSEEGSSSNLHIKKDKSSKKRGNENLLIELQGHQESIEDDIDMLNQYQTNHLPDFPTNLSQIEGSTSIHMHSGGLSNIHIDKEGS